MADPNDVLGLLQKNTASTPESAAVEPSRADAIIDMLLSQKQGDLTPRPAPPKSAPETTFARGAGMVARGAYPVVAGALAGGALGTLAGPGAPLAVPAGVLIGSTAVPLGDAVATGYNMVAEKAGLPKVGMPSEAVSGLLTKAGLPAPETGKERALEFAGNVLGAAGMPVAGAEKTIGQAAKIGDIKSMASGAYAAAKDAGVVVNPTSFDGMVSGVSKMLKEKAFDAGLHPFVDRAVTRLSSDAATATESGAPISLQDLELLRRVAKMAVNKAVAAEDADQERLGTMVVRKIDDYVQNLGADDLADSADPDKVSAAIGALKQARTLYRKAARLSDIEDILQVAKDTGKPQKIQQQFQKILAAGQKDGGYTDAEWNLVKKIGQTGSLDALSHLAPELSLSGIAKSGVATGAAGYFNPEAGVAVGALQAAGLAGRFAAPRLRAARIQGLSDMIAGGVPQPIAQQAAALPSAVRIGVPAVSYLTNPLDIDRATRALQRMRNTSPQPAVPFDPNSRYAGP